MDRSKILRHSEGWSYIAEELSDSTTQPVDQYHRAMAQEIGALYQSLAAVCDELEKLTARLAELEVRQGSQ
jgi:phage shock protein A